MYRDNHKHNLIHYNFPYLGGGLGDNIARLPVIKYILDNHPQIYVHLWVHDFFVDTAKKALGNRKNLSIKGASRGVKEYKDSLYARSPDHRESITNLATHMTDHAFYTVGHCGVSNENKNYLIFKPVSNSFNLPKKSVVVTTGYTSPVRHWLPESVDGVVNYIIKKGYTPVFLGKGETKTSQDAMGNKRIIKGNFTADYSKGINLIDKTNLLEAHSIMAQASAVVGLDNGLCPHLAAMSDVPIVVGFTTVNPIHRLPYRNNELGYNCYPVVPPESLKCRFCQSNMIFGLDHSFTSCFYKDEACTKQLTSDLFIEQLEKIL